MYASNFVLKTAYGPPCDVIQASTAAAGLARQLQGAFGLRRVTSVGLGQQTDQPQIEDGHEKVANQKPTSGLLFNFIIKNKHLQRHRQKWKWKR